MDYPKITRRIPVCLECGHKIRYGRTDKKFCCEQCRTRFNNAQIKAGRAYKRRIMKAISDNYEILDRMVRAGISSVDLFELVNLGFMLEAVTSHRRVRHRDEYACFDIKYIMTPTRISGITKISLNLRVGTKEKK
jgi:hypothetical protein